MPTVALKKPVTASDKNPIMGMLEQATDGQQEAYDDQLLEMRKGVQWVQVDLQSPHKIYVIVIWHDHRYIKTYQRVIVQIADDAEFTKNVRTLFNNNFENKAGLGIGKDRQYFASLWGRPIDGKGETGRHVRWYSNGSHMSALNNRTEMEVYALLVP